MLIFGQDASKIEKLKMEYKKFYFIYLFIYFCNERLMSNKVDTRYVDIL